jgi:hypothetical protein
MTAKNFMLLNNHFAPVVALRREVYQEGYSLRFLCSLHCKLARVGVLLLGLQL